jgi:hypothetical protein
MGEGWGCWWLTDREAEEREPESGRSDELALAVDNVLLLGRGRRGERERGGAAKLRTSFRLFLFRSTSSCYFLSLLCDSCDSCSSSSPCITRQFNSYSPAYPSPRQVDSLIGTCGTPTSRPAREELRRD